MSGLKNCPFCGSKEIVYIEPNRTQKNAVCCQFCGLEVSIDHYDADKDLMYKLWNNRADKIKG